MNYLAKLEWAALSALCILVASVDPVERLFFSASATAILFVSHVIFYFLKKFLTPMFQILFLLILVSTLFEILRFLFPFLLVGGLPQTIFTVLLMSLVSRKISEKFEIGALFFAFIFLTVLIQNTNLILAEFYPVVFIIAAFAVAALNFLYSARKKKRSN